MTLLAISILTSLLLQAAHGAKGGAKTIMRGRKGQQGAANAFAGYYGHGSNLGGRRDSQYSWEYEGSGEDSESGGEEDAEYRSPCIGLCLVYKERGISPPQPVRSAPCVGKCQHRRQHGITDPLPQVSQPAQFYQESQFCFPEIQAALCGALLSQQTEGTHCQA